jgi:hypothetical protein
MTDQHIPQPPVRRHRVRAAAVILGVALAGGIIGAFATTSFSQGFGPPFHMTVRGPMGFGGPLTTEQLVDRADRAVRHVAIELDASAEQQQKLEAIVKSAVTDLVPLRDKVCASCSPPRPSTAPQSRSCAPSRSPPWTA